MNYTGCYIGLVAQSNMRKIGDIDVLHSAVYLYKVESGNNRRLDIPTNRRLVLFL